MKKNEREKDERKQLLISHWDEWYGPIYTCPYCCSKKLMDDFYFCPSCGADLKGIKFESVEDEQKRIPKERRFLKHLKEMGISKKK